SGLSRWVFMAQSLRMKSRRSLSDREMVSGARGRCISPCPGARVAEVARTEESRADAFGAGAGAGATRTDGPFEVERVVARALPTAARPTRWCCHTRHATRAAAASPPNATKAPARAGSGDDANPLLRTISLVATKARDSGTYVMDASAMNRSMANDV